METVSHLPVQITGIGSYIPKLIVDNIALYQKIENFEFEKASVSLNRKGHDLSQKSQAEVFDLWVQQVCGIKSRPFISPSDAFYDKAHDKGLFVEYMALEASLAAIADANIDKDAIDQVILSTYSSNRTMPSAGVTLTKLLGLEGVSSITINGACSGFLDALIDAVIKVSSGHFENILVVASEQLSNKMNYQDPKTAIIFSDGAGACIVSRATESDNHSRVFGFASGTEYSEQVYMERKGAIFFNSGPLVERNAVRTMHAIALKALEKSNQKFEDIQYIVPHQANLRILHSFQNTTGFPDQQILKKIEILGNLSSASVPVTLDSFLKSEAKTLSLTSDTLNFLLISVGGGYTFSALSASIKVR